jgi:hypothetical protein
MWDCLGRHDQDGDLRLGGSGGARVPTKDVIAEWLGTAATVSDRSRQQPNAWRSTQADDHQRVLPIYPHGTLWSR